MDERDGRISVVQLVVSVHDRVHLARVIKKLRALKGVIRSPACVADPLFLCHPAPPRPLDFSKEFP